MNAMQKDDHFKRLDRYFLSSKIAYNLLLWGAKHFGYYPKGRKICEREAQELMQDLIAEKLMLTAKDNALDAGCGQGVVSTYIAKKIGCSIQGITVLPFEIDYANKLATQLDVSDKVSFSLMDYSSMDFKNSSFDCIYTMESLSHSSNIEKTLKEFYRVLKNSGRIALFEYTIAKDNKFSHYEMDILNKVAYSSAMDSLKHFRHDKFNEALGNAGFREIRAENISERVGPSLNRLRRIFILPYCAFVKPFRLQKIFPNVTAAVEFYNMGKKGLIRYCIFTASKNSR